MERTVPSTASEEVELYLRTFYSLLRTTAEVQIKSLEEVHMGMNSLLHQGARHNAPDLSALIYSLLRFPDVLSEVNRVILGQSTDMFMRHGILDVESWTPTQARARRRQCFYDGEDTLACIIASRSDIDDIVPMLTAYQIEWNKIHRLLQNVGEDLLSEKTKPGSDRKWSALASALSMSEDDLERLFILWKDDFLSRLLTIKQKKCRLSIRLLNRSLSEYRRVTNTWWEHIETVYPEILERPLYFVSSNPHSIINLMSGFAIRHQKELLDFLDQEANETLRKEWEDIQTQQVRSNQENFLYYLLKKFTSVPEGKETAEHRKDHELASGIVRISPKRSFEIEAQIIDLSKVSDETIDPRLCVEGIKELSASDALILNIDYPLGMAAYHILAQVTERVKQVLGIYMMGKAATLNGVVGDVMISNVIHDEHSRNTYLFPNCFVAADVIPYLIYGTALDNQKAVSVRGTLLQNMDYMDVFYREGYTDIEMEAGPFLSAIYETIRPKRHPVNEIVNLYELPYDLGILHYASDQPLSKGKNLGAGSLSYFGMDPTYAAAVAILRRILSQESARVASR